MRKRKLMIISSILLFIGLFIVYHTAKIHYIDLQILHYFEGLRTPAFNQFFIIVTEIGSIKVLFPLCVSITIYLLITKSYTEFALLWLAFWSSRIINFIVKESIGRERPPVLRLIEVHDFSFPSGHSMNSIVTLGFICYLMIGTRKVSPAIRNIGLFLTGIAILFVVISRLYLGVHYPTDVLAGLSLGSCLLLTFIQFLHLLKKERLVNT